MPTLTTEVADYHVTVTYTPDAWSADVYKAGELVHTLAGSADGVGGVEATAFTQVILWAGDRADADLSHSDFD